MDKFVVKTLAFSSTKKEVPTFRPIWQLTIEQENTSQACATSDLKVDLVNLKLQAMVALPWEPQPQHFPQGQQLAASFNKELHDGMIPYQMYTIQESLFCLIIAIG